MGHGLALASHFNLTGVILFLYSSPLGFGPFWQAQGFIFFWTVLLWVPHLCPSHHNVFCLTFSLPAPSLNGVFSKRTSVFSALLLGPISHHVSLTVCFSEFRQWIFNTARAKLLG